MKIEDNKSNSKKVHSENNSAERYINKDVISENDRKNLLSGQLKENTYSSGMTGSDSKVNSNSFYINTENISMRYKNNSNISENNSSYAKRTQSIIENNMKLNSTDHYVNKGIIGEDEKKNLLSGQIREVDYTSGKTEANNKIVNSLENAIRKEKIKFNKQRIKNLKKDLSDDDSKNQNVIAKGAYAVKQGARTIKDLSDDIQDNASGDNIFVERSYAAAGKAASTSVNVTKGLVKKTASVVSLEKAFKLHKTNVNKSFVKDEIKEIKGVNKTLKERKSTVYATYGKAPNTSDIKKLKDRKKDLKRDSSNLKSNVKNFEKKNKKQVKKANNKEARKAQLKKSMIDYTRKQSLGFLIKPEADKDNNMSSGFGGFVSGLAKRIGDNYFKALLKWLGGMILHIIANVLLLLLQAILFLTPILIPIAAVGSLFSFFFKDTTEVQANESYFATVMNKKYDDFDKDTYDWVLKNQNGVTGYTVCYVDDCSNLDNFEDTLILYIVLAADDLTQTGDISESDIENGGSFMLVDTDKEQEAINKAFNMLTYVEVDDKTRKIHRLKLEDIENQLTDQQKELLKTEIEMKNNSESGIPGKRTPGLYPDNVCGDIPASGKAGTAVQFALSKLGTPYSQAYRNDGKHFDCSSLVYYAWLSAGVNISPDSVGNAGTTDTEAKYFEDAGQIVSSNDLQPGDLIFLSWGPNGRYKNIDHVVMYIGDGKVVHAPKEGDVVKISNMWWQPSQLVEVARPN